MPSMSSEKPAPLPARPPEDAETEVFGPRVPWKYIALAVVTIVLVVGGYLLKEARKAAQLRAQVVRVHEELDESRDRYLAFRDKVEKLILSAGSGVTSDEVDKRLRI